MLSFRALWIAIFIIGSTAAAFAGILPLLKAGNSVSAGPPPVCSNTLDFTDSCNSQYITVI